MEVIIFFIAWLLFAEIVGVVLPVLFLLLGQLVQLLCVCVWVILSSLAFAAARLAVSGLRAARRTCRQGWLFLIILFEEWWHGLAAEEPDEEKLFEDEESEEDQRQAAHDAALALLGLKEPFAPADLKRVYRQAMKSAHSDMGGTKGAAVALNTARDLIMEVRGWK